MKGKDLNKQEKGIRKNLRSCRAQKKMVFKLKLLT